MGVGRGSLETPELQTLAPCPVPGVCEERGVLEGPATGDGLVESLSGQRGCNEAEGGGGGLGPGASRLRSLPLHEVLNSVRKPDCEETKLAPPQARGVETTISQNIASLSWRSAQGRQAA